MSGMSDFEDKSAYLHGGEIECNFTEDELSVRRLVGYTSKISKEFYAKGLYLFTEEDLENVKKAEDALIALLGNIVQFNLKVEETELKARLAALQLQIVRD